MAEPLELLLKRFSFFENSCFLRFSIRPRDALRSLGWSTFENLRFFAIFKSLARPSAEFCVVESLSLWRGAHFDEAARPKPLPSQWDLHQLSAASAAQLASSNSCYETFYSKTLLSKLFSSKSKILWLIVCDQKARDSAARQTCREKIGCSMKWELGWVVFFN